MYIKNPEQLLRLYSQLKNGLGPFIVAALENSNVLEIIVNSNGKIWLEEKDKRLYFTGETLAADKLIAALGTMAAMNDKEINAKKPMLSCVLPIGGSRVQGSVPPVSPNGPTVVIRKHGSGVYPLSQYVEEGRISQDNADYLRDMIRRHKNIVVSGGTSSGKTTLVNALIREMIEISPQDRLLVMEDTVELQYDTDNKENYTTCDDDDTRITMRDLLKMILRCRPDRIIVGEVRDGAALELLKAWNTGHPGGFATIHADNTLSALNRIESLILEVAQNPMKELIGEAVSVMVHIMDFGRIGRQITEILEVHGFHGGEYQLKHVYRHKGLDSEEIMKKE